MRACSLIGFGVLFGFSLICGGQTRAAAPATKGESTRPPVRVVPQIQYAMNGLPDPTGRFAVAQGNYRLNGLRIIDIKHKRLAWNIEPPHSGQHTGFGFSNDGRRLAICSLTGGEILDLAADQTKKAPWLKGLVLVFSPDDKLIYVAASSRTKPRWSGRYADQIYVYGLDGERVKSYPLSMNMVSRLSFSKDGKTLSIDGGIGVRLESRVGGTFTPSRQAINLTTGESLSVSSPQPTRGHAFGPTHIASGKAMDLRNFTQKTSLDRQFIRTLWDASTHSLAVISRGDVIKLWNLKEGRFSTTACVGINSIRNLILQRPGLMVGTAWYEKKAVPAELKALASRKEQGRTVTPSFVTRVQLPLGTIRPKAIPSRHWTQSQPSHDGRYLAGIIAKSVEGFTYRLQIWDVDRSVMVGEISTPRQTISGFRWTTRGQLLVLHGPYGKRRCWERFTHDARSLAVVPGVDDWGVSFSPSGNLMVVQTEGPRGSATADTYTMSVRSSLTGKEIAMFPGEAFRARVVFLNEERLLVANRGTGPTIRLLHIGDKKQLWKTTIDDKHFWIDRLSWKRGWTNAVLHGVRGGTRVLSMKDGQCLPAGATGANWRNPTLLHGGRLALDPLCGSTVLRLKETATGRTVVTFAAFADSEWIIYTPQGLWTGSPKALDGVAFYRGTKPLTPGEIAALGQPKAVRAQLATAFR